MSWKPTEFSQEARAGSWNDEIIIKTEPPDINDDEENADSTLRYDSVGCDNPGTSSDTQLPASSATAQSVSSVEGSQLPTVNELGEQLVSVKIEIEEQASEYDGNITNYVSYEAQGRDDCAVDPLQGAGSSTASCQEGTQSGDMAESEKGLPFIEGNSRSKEHSVSESNHSSAGAEGQVAASTTLGEKPKVECSVCNRLFSNKHNLERHKIVHSQENEVVCCECGKVGRRSYRFMDHLVLHTGIKTFTCKVCNKIFAVERYLKKHFRQVHPTHPPLENYRFLQLPDATSFKPCLCVLCGNTFKSEAIFTMHNEFCHGDVRKIKGAKYHSTRLLQLCKNSGIGDRICDLWYELDNQPDDADEVELSGKMKPLGKKTCSKPVRKELTEDATSSISSCELSASSNQVSNSHEQSQIIQTNSNSLGASSPTKSALYSENNEKGVSMELFTLLDKFEASISQSDENMQSRAVNNAEKNDSRIETQTKESQLGIHPSSVVEEESTGTSSSKLHSMQEPAGRHCVKNLGKQEPLNQQNINTLKFNSSNGTISTDVNSSSLSGKDIILVPLVVENKPQASGGLKNEHHQTVNNLVCCEADIKPQMSIENLNETLKLPIQQISSSFPISRNVSQNATFNQPDMKFNTSTNVKFPDIKPTSKLHEELSKYSSIPDTTIKISENLSQNHDEGLAKLNAEGKTEWYLKPKSLMTFSQAQAKVIAETMVKSEKSVASGHNQQLFEKPDSENFKSNQVKCDTVVVNVVEDIPKSILTKLCSESKEVAVNVSDVQHRNISGQFTDQENASSSIRSVEQNSVANSDGSSDKNASDSSIKESTNSLKNIHVSRDFDKLRAGKSENPVETNYISKTFLNKSVEQLSAMLNTCQTTLTVVDEDAEQHEYEAILQNKVNASTSASLIESATNNKYSSQKISSEVQHLTPVPNSALSNSTVFSKLQKVNVFKLVSHTQPLNKNYKKQGDNMNCQFKSLREQVSSVFSQITESKKAKKEVCFNLHLAEQAVPKVDKYNYNKYKYMFNKSKMQQVPRVISKTSLPKGPLLEIPVEIRKSTNSSTKITPNMNLVRNKVPSDLYRSVEVTKAGKTVNGVPMQAKVKKIFIASSQGTNGCSKEGKRDRSHNVAAIANTPPDVQRTMNKPNPSETSCKSLIRKTSGKEVHVSSSNDSVEIFKINQTSKVYSRKNISHPANQMFRTVHTKLPSLKQTKQLHNASAQPVLNNSQCKNGNRSIQKLMARRPEISVVTTEARQVKKVNTCDVGVGTDKESNTEYVEKTVADKGCDAVRTENQVSNKSESSRSEVNDIIIDHVFSLADNSDEVVVELKKNKKFDEVFPNRPPIEVPALEKYSNILLNEPVVVLNDIFANPGSRDGKGYGRRFPKVPTQVGSLSYMSQGRNPKGKLWNDNTSNENNSIREKPGARSSNELWRRNVRKVKKQKTYDGGLISSDNSNSASTDDDYVPSDMMFSFQVASEKPQSKRELRNRRAKSKRLSEDDFIFYDESAYIEELTFGDDSEDGSWNSEEQEEPKDEIECKPDIESFMVKDELEHDEERNLGEFICGVCGQEFRMKQLLINHQETHDKRKLHVCKICSKVFTEELLLRMHLKLHSMEVHKKKSTSSIKRTYECEVCGLHFLTLSEIGNHSKMHLKQKWQTPKIGNDQAKSPESKKEKSGRNMSYIHKPYVCKVCGVSVPSLPHLGQHSKLHIKEWHFLCEFCGESFAQGAKLNEHVKARHGDVTWPKKAMEDKCVGTDFSIEDDPPRKPFVCCMSNTVLVQRNYSNLLSNIWTKRKLHYVRKRLVKRLDAFGVSKKSVCFLCRKTFFTKFSLNMHMRTHKKTTIYINGVCGKSFTHEKDIVSHLKYHARIESNMCRICGKVCFREDELLAHQLLVHGARKRRASNVRKAPVVNSYKLYQDSSILKRNYEECLAARENLRLFKCEFCGESFAHSEELVEHSTCHVNSKMYVCDVCGKVFSEKFRLLHHSLGHISGQLGLYFCHMCNSPFDTEQGLMFHLKTHIDCRMYSCNKCGQSFWAAESLEKHQCFGFCEEPPGDKSKTAHSKDTGSSNISETDNKCEVCNASFELEDLLRVHLKKHML